MATESSSACDAWRFSPKRRTVRVAMTHPYLHLDVFTSTPLSGNQLAVFLDPPAWPDDTMQAVAREMNFSETTFVYPPANPGSFARMRIFTPGGELPMAGHPTIGTTFALALKGRIAPGTKRIVLDLVVGPTPVDLEWDEASRSLRFAWMTQARPTFGPPFANRDEVARSLSLEPADLAAGLPVQVVSSGVPFAYVPLVSTEAVDRARLDRAAWQRVCAANGVEEHKLFTFAVKDKASSSVHVYSRMFAPVIGISEDPGTGGASGPLGSYLVRHGVANGPVSDFLSHQGVAMKRPCEISIRIESEGSDITRVQIGGTSVLVGEAWLRV
jgi:trans-2,3-dihydro-3-hydroxyanthranilate isomerase